MGTSEAIQCPVASAFNLIYAPGESLRRNPGASVPSRPSSDGETSPVPSRAFFLHDRGGIAKGPHTHPSSRACRALRKAEESVGPLIKTRSE